MAKSKVEDTEASPAIRNLHQQLGDAVVRWALVEHRLGNWFSIVTGIDEPKARTLFYAVHGFQARLDMLAKGMAHSKLSAEQLQLTELIVSKARNYADFRNAMVHCGPPTMFAMGDEPRLMPIDKYPTVELYANGISAKLLKVAASNFGALFTIITEAELNHLFQDVPNAPSFPLSKLIKQVEQLPNAPLSSGPSQKQVGRVMQRLAAVGKLPGKRSRRKDR
jgi:hypothetical protein